MWARPAPAGHRTRGFAMTFKPAQYSTVSPYLIVSDAEATLAFLQNVFGGVELRRMPDDEGRILHSEVRLDDSVIMIADATEAWPASNAHVHVYVKDVDAVYSAALQAGAVSVMGPEQAGDEDKRGGVRDAGGTTWWIATRIG